MAHVQSEIEATIKVQSVDPCLRTLVLIISSLRYKFSYSVLDEETNHVIYSHRF